MKKNYQLSTDALSKLSMLRTVFVLGALFLISVSTIAQIPQTIDYQGILNDADGMPVNDTKFMEFRIYNVETGGTELWAEQHLNVNVLDGLFAVELGSVNPFPNNNFFNGYGELYITFFVGGEEMLPRQKFQAVPFSIRSQNAEYADEADEAMFAFGASNADKLDNLSSEFFVQQDASGNATIAGDMTANAFIGDGSALTNLPPTPDSDWTESGNYVYTLNDSIGIGTSNPAAPLDVHGHIYQSNIGGSVFLGQEAGQNDDLSNNRNVFVGYQTGMVNTGGYWNNIIGTQSFMANVSGRCNNALGYHALFSNVDGNYNTAIGTSALNLSTSGDFNIGIGYYAAYNNTTGENNIAIGRSSLNENTSGYSNIAIGSKSLYNNTEGNNLIAIGDSALYNNGVGASGSIHGTNNTAIGSKALYSNTTGYQNTATGFQALIANTTGYSNTATGSSALHSNSSGYRNTATGKNTLYSNTIGNHNTGNGRNALYSNTSGSSNTAIGNGALYYNTEGDDNTASGSGALYNNTTGFENTATGTQSLSQNTTGYENTAVGNLSMLQNTYGGRNTAIGHTALYSNTSGFYNTAIGYMAQRYNTIGSSNTAVGIDALLNNVDGYNNTAVGTDALDFNLNGNNNTAIGYNAGPNLSFLDNSTAIGYNATYSGSNHVRIGNSSIISIGGYTSWSNLSDGRFKQNVQENVPGLDFVLKLRPVTYNLDIDKLNNFQHIPDSLQNDAKLKKYADEKSAIQYTGFIAQEVEEVADQLGFDFSGVDKPQNEESHYSLRYAEFVVPLVKAVQEQQDLIEEQNETIGKLIERMNKLEQKQ